MDICAAGKPALAVAWWLVHRRQLLHHLSCLPIIGNFWERILEPLGCRNQQPASKHAAIPPRPSCRSHSLRWVDSSPWEASPMLLCNHRSRHALLRCSRCAASPAASKRVHKLIETSAPAAPCSAERLGVPLHVVSAAGTWVVLLCKNPASIPTGWSPAPGGTGRRGPDAAGSAWACAGTLCICPWRAWSSRDVNAFPVDVPPADYMTMQQCASRVACCRRSSPCLGRRRRSSPARWPTSRSPTASSTGSHTAPCLR